MNQFTCLHFRGQQVNEFTPVPLTRNGCLSHRIGQRPPRESNPRTWTTTG